MNADHLEALTKLGLLTFVLRLGLRDALIELRAERGGEGRWFEGLENRITAM